MIKEIFKKLRLQINKVGSNFRKKNLNVQNPTIISNNCWAGIVSQYLGIKYYTPTIGLYFFAEEYIKFLERFDYYIKQDLKIIETKDSRYYEKMVKKNHQNAVVGKLDDVEIVFLHMKTGEEAIEKWNKRVQRINKKYIIFKFCEQNECTKKHVERFEKLPFKNKICFTTKDYPGYKSVIWFKNQVKNDEVLRDYYESHKYLNIIDYINNMEEENL
jgi:hypothetical protein